MHLLQKNHYKEAAPEATVEKLLSKLGRLGIEVEEDWQDESYINTFSLRVNFKGTNIGANGKGTTKEFARASAYAELFERYQNGILINPRFIPKNKSLDNVSVACDEKYMSAEEIIEQEDPFMKMYFKRRCLQDASKSDKVKSFKDTNKVDYFISGFENRYVTIPFYDVRGNKVQYLPQWVYCTYYGSNGMAAGNSPYEAIVQGLSEIIERAVQKKMFTLRAGLPNVPDDYLKKYPDLYERYIKLKSVEGYIVEIKDCSFGGKYPVVGLLILQKNTGKYGMKLGCHPDFGIALERTLTETTQGMDVFEYASHRSFVDFFNRNVTDWINITNSFKVGLAQYPYQMLSVDAMYEFTEPEDVSCYSNDEICLKWINDLLKEGYDILIRDVSTLGFPSYHIIIPNLSELIDAGDDKIRAYNTRAFASGILQTPAKITKDHCKYIVASIGYFSRSLVENGLESYYADVTNIRLPFNKFGASSLYLAAMCNVMCEDYVEAYKKITMIEQRCLQADDQDYEVIKIKAISKYLSGMLVMNNHDEVMKYLHRFFTSEYCDEINDLFSDPSLVIIKQYPDISKSNDALKPLETIYKYADILKKAQMSNPIDQMLVKQLLKN